MSLQNKTFNELITFTRATGGGRFNAAGRYEWLPANEPRIDYDPVTLQPRGILIEEQRTNLLLRSAEFDSTSWAKINTAVVVNAVTAPDGSVTAEKLVEDSSYGQHRVHQQSVMLASNTTVCMSAFLKSGERSKALVAITKKDGSFRCRLFDLSAGTNSQPTTRGYTTPPVNFGMEDVGDGWYRCWVSDSVGDVGIIQDTGRVFIFNGAPSYAGDGTSGIYIWGAQLEVGSFPTSYIPTTTAQVTRAADLCSVNNLSPWYRADEGTLVVDWNLPVNTSDNNQLAAFGSAVASSMAIRMGVNSGRRVRAFAQDASGVFQYSVDCPVEASRTTGKSAFAYKLKDDFAASSAGSLNKDVSGDISNLSVDTLRVGNNPGSYANGHIRRIRYIPRRISDTELQALTAL